jgi:ribulose-phosphate 3-epimerase
MVKGNSGVRQPEIIPATMPRNLEELHVTAQEVAVFAQLAQIDVMDGDFVPSVSWPYLNRDQWRELEEIVETKGVLPSSDVLSYEAHLMVSDPLRIGELFARAGVRRIIGHIESLGTPDGARATFAAWRAAGAAEVGVSLLLSTPLSAIDVFIRDGSVDVVQVMSIAEIGHQGHAFDDCALTRVAELSAQYPDLIISVDGGVNEHTAAALREAGASRLAVGSAILCHVDPRAAFERMQDVVRGGVALSTVSR